MKDHYFIGIQIGEMAAKLANPLIEQHALAQHYKIVTHPQDYHLTFVYIGALTTTEKNSVQHILQSIANNTAPFTLTMNGYDYFGNPRGPRVIYIAVYPHIQLISLQQYIFDAASPYLQAHVQNRFTPHITICKKRCTNEPLPDISHEFNHIDVLVDAFQLFVIQPNQLPKYKVVQSFSLKKEG